MLISNSDTELCVSGAAENTAAVIVVNQTPPSIRAMEGSEFTIKCTFNTSNNSTRWFVEWNKIRNNVTEKVSNGTDQIISADKEKRSLSLTVKKADVTDCGTYMCRVGSKDVIYPGTGTQVTIEGKYQHFLLCSTNPSGSSGHGAGSRELGQVVLGELEQHKV
uniref:Ig-like domain-containing protein n=1 Tax=Gopherus evgoodei TaxID=1825980 RepID=A0A8C4Y0T0_9SAUR